VLNDLARRLASCDPRWCVSEYRDRDVTWAQPGRQRRPVASAILPVILAGSSVLGGSLTCGRSRARRGLRGEDRRLRRCGSPRREVTLVATLRPPNRRPVDAVADRVPTSVSTAFALWMVALTAGLFETVLAVMAVPSGGISRSHRARSRTRWTTSWPRRVRSRNPWSSTAIPTVRSSRSRHWRHHRRRSQAP
jgi:hypothetical protein